MLVVDDSSKVGEARRGGTDLARSLGFNIQRPLVRMCLGPKIPGEARWYFGIADPSIG